MKLSRLYANDASIFEPIEFRDGLNAIVARIYHPDDYEKSSHCLGKTLLIDVIDFCLLKQVGTKGHFLKQQIDLFGHMVFFLELELNSGEFVTVRRPVTEATTISFIQHAEKHQDFSQLENDAWDHPGLPLAASVRMLDGYLDLSAIKPWKYRNGVTYFMRRQEDYADVFRLRKFMSGSDKSWKPYVARILGFDDSLIGAKYESDAIYTKTIEEQRELQSEVTVKASDYDKLRGSIALKKDEVTRKVADIDAFDFRAMESGMNQELADEIEKQISETNEALYNARYDLNQTLSGLADRVKFSLKDVQRIFNEAELTFPDQLARDYSELVDFNKKIISERHSLLRERADELEDTVRSLTAKNQELSEKRRSILHILGGTNSLQKYKDLQKELDADRANLALMEEKFRKLEAVRALDREVREVKARCEAQTHLIDEMVKGSAERYERIRTTFGRIIEGVLRRTAILYVKQNTNGNLDFCAEYTAADGTDTETQEGRGTSFRKVLCIAFDLAVLIEHSADSFFRFVYHDGALEQLESKRRISLLSVARKTCSEHGIQYIFSAIDEDIPTQDDTQHICPQSNEVVLELHDNGTDGRLFKVDRF